MEFKVLITGDTHIPTRASKIPMIMEKIIEENKPYDAVFFTGDLISENVLKYVKTLSEKVFIVQGNMDYISLPEELIVKLANIKIGIIHGHQVYPRGNINGLTNIALRLKVQVLINGHTHYAKVEEVITNNEKIILINPGSLTGVWSGGYASLRPSFIIGEFNEKTINLILYELYGTKLEVKNFNFIL